MRAPSSVDWAKLVRPLQLFIQMLSGIFFEALKIWTFAQSDIGWCPIKKFALGQVTTGIERIDETSLILRISSLRLPKWDHQGEI